MKKANKKISNSFTTVNSPKSNKTTTRKHSAQQTKQNSFQQSDSFDITSQEPLSQQIKYFKLKYKQCKRLLNESQARLNASSREIGRLHERNQDLQLQLQKQNNQLDQLQKEKWQESDEIVRLKTQLVKLQEQKKFPEESVQRLRQNLDQIEQLVKYRAEASKILICKSTNLIVNIQKLVNNQSNFQGRSSFTQFTKELQQNLIQLKQIMSKNDSNSHVEENLQNSYQYQEMCLELENEIRNLKEERSNLQDQLQKSKGDQEKLVTQYRNALDKMRDHISSMRDRIVQLETSNNQQEEKNQLKIKALEQEKLDLQSIIDSLQATIQEQSAIITHLKEYIHNIEISNQKKQQLKESKHIDIDTRIKQIYGESSEFQESGFQVRHEKDIQKEIFKIDQEIQILQQNLQDALHDSSHQ